MDELGVGSRWLDEGWRKEWVVDGKWLDGEWMMDGRMGRHLDK